MTDGFNLGSAYGSIIIDASGVAKGVSDAKSMFQRGLDGMGDMVKNFGDNMADLGKSLTILTAPLSAFFITGSKVAGSFESVMTQIKVFGNVSAGELEKVRAFVLKMGADTVFTSQDAGEAMLDLLKSGMKLEDAMKTLPTVLELATVGNLSLADSSAVVTGALAQFGLGAGDAERVADAIAKGANASKADVSDLGQALREVGPIAAQYGLSIEDTVAILSEFANANMKGANAGQQLESMLRIMATNNSAQDTFRSLGISMSYTNAQIEEMARKTGKDLPGSFVEMATTSGDELDKMRGKLEKAQAALADLQKKMDSGKELTETQKLKFRDLTAEIQSLNGALSEGSGTVKTFVIDAKKAKLLGLPAPGDIRPINDIILDIGKALRGMPMDKQIKTMKELAGAYGESGLAILLATNGIADMRSEMDKAPSAAAVATASIGTWDRMIESLTGSIEALQITAIQPLQEKLKPVIASIIEFVNRTVDWMTANPELANTIVEIAAAVTALGPILFVVGTAIGAIGTIIAALPFAVFIAAIGLLGAAFATNFGGIRDIVIQTIGTVGDIITQVWGQIQPVLQMLYDWFVTQALPQIVAFIQGTVIPAIDRFFGFLAQVWTIVGPHLNDLWKWFTQEALPGILSFISGTVIPGIQNFIGILIKIWDDVSPKLIQFLDWFMNTGLPAVGKAISDFNINVVQPVIKVLSGIWDSVSVGLTQFFDWFTTSGLPKIQEGVNTFKVNFLDPLVKMLSDIWNTVGNALGLLHDWFVVNALPKIQDALKVFKETVLDPVINLLSGLWEHVKASLGAFWDWVNVTVPRIVDFFGGIFKAVDEVINRINDFITKTKEALGLQQTTQNTDLSKGNVLGLPIPHATGGGLDKGWNLLGDGGGPELVYSKTGDGGQVFTADQTRAMMNGGGSGGGTSIDNSMHFAAGAFVIQANSYEEGQAAAAGFEAKLNAGINRRG